MSDFIAVAIGVAIGVLLSVPVGALLALADGGRPYRPPRVTVEPPSTALTVIDAEAHNLTTP